VVRAPQQETFLQAPFHGQQALQCAQETLLAPGMECVDDVVAMACAGAVQRARPRRLIRAPWDAMEDQAWGHHDPRSACSRCRAVVGLVQMMVLAQGEKSERPSVLRLRNDPSTS